MSEFDQLLSEHPWLVFKLGGSGILSLRRAEKGRYPWLVIIDSQWFPGLSKGEALHMFAGALCARRSDLAPGIRVRLKEKMGPRNWRTWARDEAGQYDGAGS